MNSRPLVPVTTAVLRTGRGSLLGPDTARRTAWWELTLGCGHMVERRARYKPLNRGWQYKRSTDDVLPSPRRARCDYAHDDLGVKP